jgi:hypothetical protein
VSDILKLTAKEGLIILIFQFGLRWAEPIFVGVQDLTTGKWRTTGFFWLSLDCPVGMPPRLNTMIWFVSKHGFHPFQEKS